MWILKAKRSFPSLCPPAHSSLGGQLDRVQPGIAAHPAWGEGRGKRPKMLQADAIGEEEMAAQLAH